MTNNPSQPTLSKICTNCGQQKPLSAFLEMTEAHGTVYGSICSACRKTALLLEENRRKTDAEGSTTTESGHKIDAKTKLHSDIDKRELVEKTEKEYHAERDINETLTIEQLEKKSEQEHLQRKFRENFLKRNSFITNDVKKPAQNNSDTKVATQNNQQHTIKTSISDEHRKKTEYNATAPDQGQQISGKLLYTGVSFQAFRDYLGTAGNLVSNKDQATKSKEAAKSKNPAVDYIEKKWEHNPSGGGRKR